MCSSLFMFLFHVFFLFICSIFWILTIWQITFLPCQLFTFSFHKYGALEGGCKEEEEERTWLFSVSCGLLVCFPVSLTTILVEILHPSKSSWIICSFSNTYRVNIITLHNTSFSWLVPSFSKGVLVPCDPSSKFRDAGSSQVAHSPQGSEFQLCRTFPLSFWVSIILVPSLGSSGPRVVAFSCSCYLPDSSPFLIF